MGTLTERMLDTWTSGKTVRINDEFSTLTSRIALKTLFDLDDDGDREQFNDTLRVSFDLMSARLRRIVKLPLWVPTPETLCLKNQSLNSSEKWKASCSGARRQVIGDDLLSRLMLAQHEDGTRMSDQQLRDEVMTLYLAGHETTALTLTWTWYLLAQHQRVEDKLASEWQQVLGGRTPTADQLQQLPYTAAVISEAMRLFPPVYAIGREATADLELGSYQVKRGFTVLMSQWVNHRDPKYFPEPEEFRPERWKNGYAKRIPKFAYYPFGGGQRMCVGSTFALIEAPIVLATVGQRYRFTVDPEAAIGIKPQITLEPANAIPATLLRR
jgi:cytochrome P450